MTDSAHNPILVTGISGRVGGVDSAIIETLRYVDVPSDQRRDQELGRHNLPGHLFEHFLTMARLHAANSYDRLTHDVEAIIGRPATSIRDFVAQHNARFEKPSMVQGSVHVRR